MHYEPFHDVVQCICTLPAHVLKNCSCYCPVLCLKLCIFVAALQAVPLATALGAQVPDLSRLMFVCHS